MSCMYVHISLLVYEVEFSFYCVYCVLSLAHPLAPMSNQVGDQNYEDWKIQSSSNIDVVVVGVYRTLKKK